MRPRLFLTGDIGCGKSTILTAAIADRLPSFGGFVTRRVRDDRGHAIAFLLESPDGTKSHEFLDCRSGSPKIHMEVFRTQAPAMMEGRYLILDEIGGLELLQPEFMAALDRLLSRPVPIIGVVKGPGPAAAMIRRLGLEESYAAAADALRARLARDENTLLYTCGQYDAQALALAEQWVKEYVHD